MLGLAKVFGGSVALYNVRIVEGRSGVFGANQRPFTLGNTIYMKRTEPARFADMLVHEVVHVWQYQHLGPRYTADLGAQARYGEEGRAPSHWEAGLARGGQRLARPQQGGAGPLHPGRLAQRHAAHSLRASHRRGRLLRGPGGGAPTVEFRFGPSGADRDQPMAVAARDALQGRPTLRLSNLLRRYPAGRRASIRSSQRRGWPWASTSTRCCHGS